MKDPNFFIVGAPKCGTTSIAEWLRVHPQAYLSTPKELDYFDTDHKKRYRDSWVRYRAYFAAATERHIAVGEASVGYLRSEVAIPRIRRAFPDAKFVVCIRNPACMAISWHNQMLNTGWETVSDFARAWALQSLRVVGDAVPRTCPEPSNLIYRNVCALGTQLEIVMKVVPAEKVHVILLDDLIAAPRKSYVELLKFLGLADDGREEFPAENVARRLPRMFSLMARLAIDAKQGLGVRRGFGLISALTKLVAREGVAGISESHQQALLRYFEPEVKKLETLLGRDLSAWRQPSTAPNSDFGGV